ncbi:hypothetical protein Tco_0628420 [Tanacetum coccineum]|uniref:Uncharacterized protein n=1 Tax=Tanacetum coccineum TaxID=301880 RepID=A0ABQ4WQD5_9ASTR
MVISSPCLTDIKNWLVQKQTTFGKDFSNPFTADSLLKTIWFSTHHASHAPCYSNEALAIPEQTATGKEISNPFMAGEDCWVLEDFTTYCCWFNIGAASEDLVLLRKIEENRLNLQDEAAPVGEQPGPPAPRAAKQLTAKRNQERVKSILLLAIPDKYLLKFILFPMPKSHLGCNQIKVKQQNDGMFISHDKYVADILKKFDFCSIKSATTPIASNKPLVKDEDGVDVDVPFHSHSKSFTLKCTKKDFLGTSNNNPKLGLWYPKDSPFELEAFSDSDYGGASLDRKSTTDLSPKDVEVTRFNLLRLRATYGAELVSAASLVNTARLTLSTVPLVVVTEASIRSSLLFNDADALVSIKDAQAAEISALKSRIKKFKRSTSQHLTSYVRKKKLRKKECQFKDVDDSSRPARSILTLKPLPTIDPKDKGKGVLEESPVKKVKRTDMDAAQIAKDAEITRLIHEKELAKIEKEKKERQRQDQASMDYIASLYDEVQAKMYL